MGAVRITLTAIAQNVNFFLLENHQAAIAVPINPPRKDIPPCQTADARAPKLIHGCCYYDSRFDRIFWQQNQGANPGGSPAPGQNFAAKPSENHAYFYSLVNRDTVEQDFNLNAGSFSSIRVTNTLSEAKIPFRF